MFGFTTTVLSTVLSSNLDVGYQPGEEALWLWLGTLGMFVGMVYFIFKGRNVVEPRMKKFYIVTTFIAGIAFTNYLTMATGVGVIDIAPFIDGTSELPIYWARYTDWILTTPLLIYDLMLLANADRETTATLIGLDVMMILTGLVATLTVTPVGQLGIGVEANRILWWGVSTGFFLVLIYYLFSGLSDKVEDLTGDKKKKFNTLRYMIVVLWAVYPIWWLIGSEGLGMIDLYIETAGFMLLDLTAKVGFGVVLLRSHSILDDSEDTVA